MKKSKKAVKRQSGVNWTVLVIGAGAVVGIAASVRPWQFYLQQKRATTEQAARTSEAQRKYNSDVRLGAHLDTSIGREELARQSGWHKKGEVPVGDAAH